MGLIIEIEQIYQEVDCLLEKGTIAVAKKGIQTEETIALGVIDQGVELVLGNFPYERRLIGVPGSRVLIGKVTRQPVLALRETLEKNGVRVRPLPYAEDVDRLPPPLAARVVGYLETLR